MSAAYAEAYRSGRLKEALRRATRWMKRCTMCPRMCRVDRMAGERGFCKTGRHAVVASYGPHYGEERPLVGRGGSGDYFFLSLQFNVCFLSELRHKPGRGGDAGLVRKLSPKSWSVFKEGAATILILSPRRILFSRYSKRFQSLSKRGWMFRLSLIAEDMSAFRR